MKKYEKQAKKLSEVNEKCPTIDQKQKQEKIN